MQKPFTASYYVALCRISVHVHGEPGNFKGKHKEFTFLNKIINGRMKHLNFLSKNHQDLRL